MLQCISSSRILECTSFLLEVHMRQGSSRYLLAAVVALALGACTPAPAVRSTFAGDPAHPAAATGWVDTKLYFGLGLVGDAKGVDDAGWRAFLDKEVTPRFPDGLSVVDVYGQWQGARQATPERLRSKMLVIDYPDTAANRASVEAIRAAWKAKTGDLSVLRVTQPAEVSF
jgi:hypothetical protein